MVQKRQKIRLPTDGGVEGAIEYLRENWDRIDAINFNCSLDRPEGWKLASEVKKLQNINNSGKDIYATFVNSSKLEGEEITNHNMDDGPTGGVS